MYYVVYRVAVAGYFSVMLVVSIVKKCEFYISLGTECAKWFIYLTNWSLILLTLTVILHAFLVTWVFATRRDTATLGGCIPRGAYTYTIFFIMNCEISIYRLLYS